MYNEESCRSCGRELTSLYKCKYCDETRCWKCSSCDFLLQRLHTHPLESTMLNRDQRQNQFQNKNPIIGNQITK